MGTAGSQGGQGLSRSGLTLPFGGEERRPPTPPRPPSTSLLGQHHLLRSGSRDPARPPGRAEPVSEALESHSLTFSKVPSSTWQWPKYSGRNEGTGWRRRPSDAPAAAGRPSPTPRGSCHHDGHVLEPGAPVSLGPRDQEWARGCRHCLTPTAALGPPRAVCRQKKTQGVHTVSFVHHGMDHQRVDLSVQVEAELAGKQREEGQRQLMLPWRRARRKGGRGQGPHLCPPVG